MMDGLEPSLRDNTVLSTGQVSPAGTTNNEVKPAKC